MLWQIGVSERQAGTRNPNHGLSISAFGVQVQASASALIDGVHGVVDHLHENLKQLIRISADHQ
jgi:hypothetical protein